MKTLYTSRARVARGGRDGHVRSSDGIVGSRFENPQGDGRARRRAGTNPEQLFACPGTQRASSRRCAQWLANEKKVLTDTSVTGHVSFNVSDDGKYVLSVELHGKGRGHDAKERDASTDECGTRSLPLLQRDSWQHRSKAHRRVTQRSTATLAWRGSLGLSFAALAHRPFGFRS